VHPDSQDTQNTLPTHDRPVSVPPPIGASEPRPIFPVDMLPQGFVWRLVVFLIVLTAVRLVTVYYARTDFFYDESQYWSWSLDLEWGYFSKPPLIAWLIRAGAEICGNGQACIRSISTVVHTATSVIVFLLTRKLFDERFGFWAAVVFATLPGISLSSTLITTDVPLLFFWALALLCLVKLLETRAWIWAVTLGLAVGLGLLAKYAMIYFFLGLAVYMMLSPRARWLLSDLRGAAVVAIAGGLLAPNIAWNLQNGLVTFAHTADNANWSGSLVNPLQALEFFGAQFGVFGPIVFGILIWATWRAVREGWSDPYRFLLCFAVPIVLLITLQAFLSRAHANWGATAYVSASVLVAALMVERRARGWYAASFLIHIFALAVISFGTMFAGQVALPGVKDPFARVLGWQAIARGAEQRFAGGDFGSIMADHRSLTASMIYYLRDQDIPIVRWRGDGPPSHHFELKRPITAQTPEPILFVTRRASIGGIGARFDSVTKMGEESFAAGPTESRRIHFYRLEGFRAAN
jgi:4-amino-4-deoxy-L-arabinose transferase-like glycosyltransferase